MSNAARLFFASGLSLLAGGALGAYVERAIHGADTHEIDPAPKEKVCPPCKECPPCAPPPDCSAPTQAAATATTTAPGTTRPHPSLAPGEGDEPERDRKPGLPASAVQLASARVRERTTPCLDEAAKSGAHGIILLDLTVTVTATSSQGFISEAGIRERSSDAKDTAAAEACIIEAAKKTRFDISAPDGEAHFRIPVKLDR